MSMSASYGRPKVPASVADLDLPMWSRLYRFMRATSATAAELHVLA